MWWRKALHKFLGFFGIDWPKIPPSQQENFSGGDFEGYLADKMNPETAKKVVDIFGKLQLPLPKKGEFLEGTEGALVFLNRYGVVLRIEHKKPEFTDNIVRLDNNPLVLRPIASIPAKDAIVEVVPGSHSDGSEKDSLKVKELLAKANVDYWDDGAHNIGLLPFKTPQFPNGIPVVIDRLAVAKFSERLKPVKVLLKALGLKSDPQEALYGKLTEAFNAAWRKGTAQVDAPKMAAFWRQAERSLKAGQLIAGWNEYRKDTYKIAEARREAKKYDAEIEKSRETAGVKGHYKTFGQPANQ